ncbi:hypothetical protein C8F04DRAFT_1078224 [Mycena alexandri]|uniref:Uncharacterized protein n=1 Tax=Mycena alexandri TaxID=1745969 RepID=A0AAD6TD23_9AGAR|nr:hypothetical protein C8F04DRAFT_1078224 [Mycena alexandri]
MTPNTLSHRGMDAWLQSPDETRLQFSGPALVEDNTITVVIEVENPKSYHLEWCKSSGATAMNAWCEIFRPIGKSRTRIGRIANGSMAADSPATQSCSSRDQLELPLNRDAWLWSPRSGEGFVSLEIRRMRKPAHETVQKEESKYVVYETPVDMIDDPDTGMPPYIIFRFEFKQRARSSNPQSAPTSEHGDRRISGPESRASTSDPSPPPLTSVLAKSHKSSSAQSQGDNNKGEGSSNINRSPSSQEREHKRARYDQLMQEAREDTIAQAKKLEEEKAECRRLDVCFAS